MRDRVALEDIQGIHRCNTDVVCFVRQCEILHCFRQILSWGFVARCDDRFEFRIRIRSLERLCGARAFAGILARHDLQRTPWMPIRRMPEERRRPAGRSFADSVNGVSGDAEKRKRFGPGLPGPSSGTPRVLRFGHFRVHGEDRLCHAGMAEQHVFPGMIPQPGLCRMIRCLHNHRREGVSLHLSMENAAEPRDIRI